MAFTDVFRFASKFYERIPRTIAKTVTWRVWMMVTNSLIGWFVTGDPWKGLAVGLLALVINSTLYIIHERLWNKADWGREIKEKPPIL